MILCDDEIRAAVIQGTLALTPFDDSMVQPASVDLRLDHHFRVFVTDGDHKVIDPARQQPGIMHHIAVNTDRAFILRPGDFALACTYETVSISSKLCGRLEGKSGLGRLGLMTHVTAGYIDPGFYGQITLELHNVAPMPLALYPGMKIAQLSLSWMSQPPIKPYGSTNIGSHYQGQSGPTPSMSWVNFRLTNTREGRNERDR